MDCNLELRPISSILAPVTKRGYLPMRCANISVKVSAHKLSNYHSWQLDIKYSSSDLFDELVWDSLPLLLTGIHVGKNNSLQAAINSAMNGSMLYVEPGHYNEHLYINKTLHLVSTGGSTETHVFGEVFVTARGVILQGFTFYPSVQSFSTINVNSSFVTIVNCRFVDSMKTFALYSPLPTIAIDCEHCPQIQIVNNYFYGWKHSIVLKDTNDYIIQTNMFTSCRNALLLTSEEIDQIIGNFFMQNIIGIEYLFEMKTDKLLNANTFSGNVIPLLCNGRVFLHPYYIETLHKESELLQLSNELFVTGLCSTELPVSTISHSSCIAIVHSNSPKGV